VVPTTTTETNLKPAGNPAPQCFHCKSESHLVKDCPTKRQAQINTMGWEWDYSEFEDGNDWDDTPLFSHASMEPQNLGIPSNGEQSLADDQCREEDRKNE
jgi:hypothetical protein